MNETATANPTRTFNVLQGTTSQTVVGRTEAVAMAKTLSRENGQRVSVERTDGLVQMQFFNGTLDTFVCETRDRR